MNNQAMVIRPIRVEDIPVVEFFLLQQLKELFTQEGQLAITDDVLGLAEMYLEPGKSNMWGVFTSRDEVVGTAAISPYNDRIDLLKGRYNLPITAEVGRFYISKDLRRQGIGSKLIKEVAEFCRKDGYQIMYLHTHRFLPGGFHFWAKQGFKITIDEGGSAEIVHMEKLL